MRRVLKYQLDLNSYRDGSYKIDLEMPSGSIVRYIDVDPSGVPCLWAEVDEDAPKMFYTFSSVGTGHGAVPEGMAYAGSTVLPSGYVFHLYGPRIKP